ncbi:MAG: MmgE/PrpD family protein, partial [Alphaproteobacteria bacterium]
LPDDAIHWAKRAIIDWCAATAPGSVVMPAPALVRALSEDIGHGEARLFPSGVKATTRTAAVINGAASHAVEFDDIFRGAIYHPATPVISAAMAVADATDASGDALLRAVITGYEVSTRIALVMGRAHYRYWHNTATNGSFGSAVAAGSLLGLDRDGFANAIGLVGTMAAGLQQAFRSDSDTKPMHGAHAAETGVLCAQSAAHGVRGVLDILEGEVGYGAAMSENCDWSIATKGLGTDYNITRMTTKNHGCCGHTFAGIDAALAIKEQHGVSWDDIKSIHLDVYSSTVDICSGREHRTPFEGKFSMCYLAATAFTHGSVRLDAFDDTRLTHPDTTALAKKVTLSLDKDIDDAFPAQRSARITVETNDGRTLEHFQANRKGDPELPLSDAELAAKYTELAAPVMGDAAAASLLDALWALESLASVRRLPIGMETSAVRAG